MKDLVLVLVCVIMRIEEVSHFMVKHGCERTGHVNVFAKVQMERLQTTLL